MSLGTMASTRQAGERIRVEAFAALVAKVKADPSHRDLLIASAVGSAVHLSDQSKVVFRGQCKRVADPRVLSIFGNAVKFSERVIAERNVRDPKMPTVQHVLLDVCKRIIAQKWKSPVQAMSDLEAGYNVRSVYP